ncbi:MULTISPECIES: PE/PPE C-terminal domain-containing protein, partial [unclassified Mycobacterium]|uniref:PE/PPE C-terminal domain-containing protein n=1 Tax=unclassified Mycobacterium TaxID=2642494 RepID=UPI000AF1F853
LEPFPAPPNTTTPDATTDQAMAVSRAATEPAGNVAHAASNTGSQLGAVAPMQQLATTAAAADDPGPFTWLQNLIQDLIGFGLPTPNNNFLGLNPTLYNVIFKLTSGLAYFSNGIANFGWSIGQQLTYGPGGATVGAGGAWFPTPQFATLGLGNLGAGVGHVGGGAAAAAGQAARVGMLSVPQQWATLTSAVTPAVAESEGALVPAGAAGAAGANSPNALLRGMPMGGMGRRGATPGYVNKYGFRYSVLTRPPSAG